MAENLNIGTMINGNQEMTENGIIEKYCNNNSEANCDVYGGLYQWDEMMDYTTIEGAQGICPEGWYLPSDDEWCILEKQVENTISCLSTGYRGTIGGGKLKENGTSHWNAPNTGATNESGFTALPGSRRNSNGMFGTPGNDGGWWSSSDNDFSGIHRSLWYDLSKVGRFFGIKTIGFSVRCLKDGFFPNIYNLNLEADPTHAGFVSGAGQYFFSEEVNITATSNPGWKFIFWTDDDGIVSTAASFIYTMPAQDITLTAHFIEAFQLDLEAAPSNAGIVSGAGQYEAGEDVNISATANPGWEFVNWTDDDGIVSTVASFTYTMPAQDVTLTATFIEDQGGFNCGATLIDPRDGQSYATVKIGDQCWMAENLNIGTMIYGNQDMTNNGIIEKYCFNNNEANCSIYGGLYQWTEMMQYTTTPGVKGICPEGWHLPTNVEWTNLTTYVSSQPAYLCNSNTTYIAKALAATTNWTIHTGTCTVGNNLTLNNATSFTALPGGYRNTDGSFGYLNNYGIWWSSSQYDASKAWYRTMNFSGAHVHGDNYYKSNAYSVRCLKDVSPPPITYILHLEADPSDAGILNGAGQYQADEDVNISATVIPGWQFLNWTDDDGIVSTAPNFIYTMPFQDITLTAHFIEAQGGVNCGDLLIDIRDGKAYATVQIGDQCWMAENLNIGTMINVTQEMEDNGIIEKYCYENDEANCDIYGGLYQWDEMMGYSISPGAKGICPDGWYLPTDAEWTNLTTYLEGEDVAGGKLKEAGTGHWLNPNTGATNSSGFTALPGGGRSLDGEFLYKNQQGTWWTSSQHNDVNAWKRSLSYMNIYVYRFNNNKSHGFSVRCIKNDL